MKNNPVVCGIEITHPNRIIYSKDKITKLDVVKYYEKIYNKLIPYLKNRLVSEIRCFGSTSGEKFYKKHPQKNSIVERYYLNNRKNPQNEYFYINTKKQLISEVQLGAVEFHIWNCKVDNINNPDFMIFDLDPDENLALEKVKEGARYLKKTLNKLNLKSILKTSGGKGYHILVKIEDLNTKKVEKLSKEIAIFLEQTHPELFVTNMSKDKRKGKIFIDYLRNKKGATCVAPFSLRLRENAPVSVIIPYSKLENISPSQVTIKDF